MTSNFPPLRRRAVEEASSYDAVPYASHAIGNTHPDSLATMGILHGMRPPEVENCRVLELGCAEAGNLIAMATTLPRARFTGIDASHKQIEKGRELAAAAEVANVDLRAIGILEFPDGEEFDYIVCHGVYSWVAPDVQDRILEILARRLSPQGIAYLSYNTYPGCHLKDLEREMMLFHVRNIEDPAERIRQARALLGFLGEFARDSRDVYRILIERFVRDAEEEPDWYFFHEYLEEHNTPLYFHELVRRAEEKGLQYLSGAEFIAWEHYLPPAPRETLGRLGNRIVREQYLDFLGNRMFRRSLFCRSDAAVTNEPRPDRVGGLSAEGRVRPARPDADVGSEDVEEFVSYGEARFSTDRPLVKAALAVLAEAAPCAVPVESLWPMTAKDLGAEVDAAGAEELSRALLSACQLSVISLHAWSPPLARSPGERLVATPLARLQAARNEPIVNLRHRIVEIGDLDRVLLERLDGTRDRPALLHALAEAWRSGLLGVSDRTGEPVADPEKVGAALAAELEPALERLAAAALLAG